MNLSKVNQSDLVVEVRGGRGDLSRRKRDETREGTLSLGTLLKTRKGGMDVEGAREVTDTSHTTASLRAGVCSSW